MDYKNILLEFQLEGKIAVIKFNRPKALNAINQPLLTELTHALNKIESENVVRVLVITGEGKAFMAGADIAYISTLSPLEARRFVRDGQELFFRLERLPIPVIACVNGFALGGGAEIAMACDFIYSSERARFGQPEINLGIMPGFGGTQRLPRLVGKAVAKELCMTGRAIDAQEAKEIGLVNRVFSPESLWEETIQAAATLASKSRTSLRAIKRCIDRGLHLDMHTACYMEAESFGMCVASPDAAEGMSAFLEKRKPDFKGDLI